LSIESKIGFDILRNILIKYCNSDIGRELIEELKFSSSVSTIKTQLQETVEMQIISNEEEDFPTPSFTNVRSAIQSIQVDGTYLSAEDIFKLVKSLKELQSLCSFFIKHEEFYPTIFSQAELVSVPQEVITTCESILDKYGHLKDNASPELARIRSAIASRKIQINKKMAQLLTQARKEGWADSDTELSVRNGRLVIPMISSFKRKLKGLVHDESSTGKTSYVEPSEVFNANNEISNLEFEEQREILQILRNTTSVIRPYIHQIDQAYFFLAYIDSLQAKSKLANRLDATIPIVEDEPIIDLIGAKHPLLQISYEKSKKEVIPLRVFLDKQQRILVISGPNAGGKSVCLKSVVLLQYMLQCGLLIPCDGHSKMGVFSQIFVDIGDEQSLENDLSTYSSHLLTMKHFLTKGNDSTLACIDEFGTGTEPLLGGAIAESILEGLHERNMFAVITTHYTNLKHSATALPHAENAAMLFDSENMRPFYKLRIGTPGSSFAFEIAESIGIPYNVLQNAKTKIGQDHVDFDKNLKQLEKEKQYVFRKKEEINKQKEKLKRTQEDYENKIAAISKKRVDIVEKTKNDLSTIIQESNKAIENTIRVIKESQANKEKTKLAREKLELQQFELQNRINNSHKKAKNSVQHTKQVQSKEKTKGELQVGDFVLLEGQSVAGQIIEINKKQALVEFGNLKSYVSINKLSITKKPKGKRTSVNIQSSTKTISTKRQNFSSKIDVRGKRADEALYDVQDFIETAYMLQVKKLEILHGKGNGVLRKILRDYLETQTYINNIADAPLNQGGDGITLLTIE